MVSGGCGNLRRPHLPVLFVQVMAYHQHVQMFIDGIYRVRAGGIGRCRQYIREGGCADNIRRMAPTGAFCVEGMYYAAVDGLECIFQEAGFIQRIRVDGNLHVQFIGYFQGSIYYGRRSAPVFMNFQPQCACGYLFYQRPGGSAIPFTKRSRGL